MYSYIYTCIYARPPLWWMERLMLVARHPPLDNRLCAPPRVRCGCDPENFPLQFLPGSQFLSFSEFYAFGIVFSRSSFPWFLPCPFPFATVPLAGNVAVGMSDMQWTFPFRSLESYSTVL